MATNMDSIIEQALARMQRAKYARTAENYGRIAMQGMNSYTTQRGQDLTNSLGMRGQDIEERLGMAGHEVTKRGQDINERLGMRGFDVAERGQDLTNSLGIRGQDLTYKLGELTNQTELAKANNWLSVNNKSLNQGGARGVYGGMSQGDIYDMGRDARNKKFYADGDPYYSGSSSNLSPSISGDNGNYGPSSNIGDMTSSGNWYDNLY
jgi:hypothetical protein